MMENQNHKTERKQYDIRWLYLFAAVISFLAMAVFALMGWHIWQKYENTLMTNQKEQLQLVSQALSSNMEVSLREYSDTLDFLCKEEESNGRADELFREFLDTQDNFIYDLCRERADYSCQHSFVGKELKDYILLTQASSVLSLWQCSDENDHKYLALKKQLSDGSYLCLIIDSEAYYKELISNIHVGTNGYIVIKNSTGLLIMHPSPIQWGIDVIEGRMQLFPDLDYSSLSDMVDKQESNDSGLYEYYSYWWTNTDLPRVRKVSAHNHLSVGKDFWIVSAVVDYSDLYSPIAEGFRGILLLMLCVMVSLGALAATVVRLLWLNHRSVHEIEYLRQLNDTLEELHRSEESLAHQQRLQVMGAMTGGIAHEFNNFLTPILGYSDLLMSSFPEDSDDYESAHEIYEAADKARDVIRQISAMSRKNVETVFSAVSVKKLLDRSHKMGLTICPKGVTLITDLHFLKEEEVLGNSTQLHQVILNIIVNAIRAIDADEGVITLSARGVVPQVVSKYIREESVSQAWRQYVHITIQDNGCGMDANTLRHIFEPFYTTRKTGEGTGLGLSIAEQIVHYHHGYLCAESCLGKGSTFHLFLPIMEAGQESNQRQWGQSQSLRVLVADDSPKIRQLLERQFIKLGVEIATCSRREELEELLDENYFNVLAIDETLENEDGISFCMAYQGKNPSLIKIIMTQSVTREIVDAKNRHIIDDYVVKPVSDTTLLAVVRRCRESDHSVS